MEIAIKFSREGGPRRAAGWWLQARPRFLADFWGRNLAEAEPFPRLPPPPTLAASGRLIPLLLSDR